MPRERLVVFMDYQNVHGWARRKFYPGGDAAQGHVDPLRIGLHLCKRRNVETDLAQVRVYRGRPNPARQEGAARANDRQAAEWEKSPMVKVIRRNIDYPPQWPDKPASEKGIDVAIAVDMMRLAMTPGSMDAAILFSSDKDLLPALEAIRELDLCKVEVATWAKGNRLRFEGGGEQLWSHNIDEQTFRTLEDTTDYAARPEA